MVIKGDLLSLVVTVGQFVGTPANEEQLVVTEIGQKWAFAMVTFGT